MENDVVKKGMYDELVTKVNAIDLSKLVKKLNMTRKLTKLKRKYLAMINILLMMNLIH